MKLNIIEHDLTIGEPKMRDLVIDNTFFEVSDEIAEKLIESGALVQQTEEDGNYLHLNSDHKFSVDEVKLLLVGDDT